MKKSCNRAIVLSHHIHLFRASFFSPILDWFICIQLYIRFRFGFFNYLPLTTTSMWFACFTWLFPGPFWCSLKRTFAFASVKYWSGNTRIDKYCICWHWVFVATQIARTFVIILWFSDYHARFDLKRKHKLFSMFSL